LMTHEQNYTNNEALVWIVTWIILIIQLTDEL
jgi:hypothetical protein